VLFRSVGASLKARELAFDVMEEGP
jgi:hypothetical protein